MKDYQLHSNIVLDRWYEMRGHDNPGAVQFLPESSATPHVASVFVIVQALSSPPKWVVLYEIKNKKSTVVEPKVGFPSGGLEPGETPEVAASRELAEETGIEREITKDDFLFVILVRSDEDCGLAIIPVYRIFVPPDTAIRPGPDQLEAAFLTREEIDKALQLGVVFANHQVAWMRYQLFH